MSDFDRNQYAQTRVGAPAAGDAVYDEGLRSYMLGIYNYMAAALVITGLTAFAVYSFAVANPAFAQAIYASPLRWIIMFAPLAFVLVLSFGIERMSFSTAQLTFWVYSAVMGLSLSWIFMVYTGESITQTFFVTAAAFGSLSLFGYTTKRNLSGFGSFLFMGLIGLIIAAVVNIFLQSSMMSFIISAAGVLIFAGLTAYDSQRLKYQYEFVAGTDFVGKAMLMGALSMYLNFINLFMFLLSFLGNRE